MNSGLSDRVALGKLLDGMDGLAMNTKYYDLKEASKKLSVAEDILMGFASDQQLKMMYPLPKSAQISVSYSITKGSPMEREYLKDGLQPLVMWGGLFFECHYTDVQELARLGNLSAEITSTSQLFAFESELVILKPSDFEMAVHSGLDDEYKTRIDAKEFEIKIGFFELQFDQNKNPIRKECLHVSCAELDRFINANTETTPKTQPAQEKQSAWKIKAQNIADELWRENPKLLKYQVADKIGKEFKSQNILNDRGIKPLDNQTIYKHIRIKTARRK